MSKLLAMWRKFWSMFSRKPSTPTPDPVPDTPTTPTTGTANPRPTASEAGLQSQQVKWKVDNDGKGATGIARTVVRWPSFLAKRFAITAQNSCTEIDGAFAKFYKFDTEKGNNRASYTIDRKASTFPANSQVWLVVNDVRVAGFRKADTAKYADFDMPERMEDVVP